MTQPLNPSSSYIPRECQDWLERIIPICPILSIMGPRQAGKTKLMRKYFPHLPYYDFEDEQTQIMVRKDVIGFVRANINGAIFDEFQHVPEITQALKVVADEIIWDFSEKGIGSKSARFILTGSHNYVITGKKYESMVGRANIIELPPMSASELNDSNVDTLMFKGGYPALYVYPPEAPATFFPRYIITYLQREIRDVHNITDLSKFEDFMQMCANRVGNILNHDMMASDLGLPVETVQGWLSILEASYIIFRARPYYNNFEKRLVKRPKLYFYDTGLAAHLLELESQDELQTSLFRGKLFENLVVSEIKKKLLNQGRISTPIYFWNIEKGEENPYEVDVLFKAGGAMRAVEVKASNTLNPRWFHGATRLNELMPAQKYVVYTGPTMTIPEGKAVNFKDLDQIFIDTPMADPRHERLDED
jgi:predicted AAA+ superfamily ATPase